MTEYKFKWVDTDEFTAMTQGIYEQVIEAETAFHALAIWDDMYGPVNVPYESCIRRVTYLAPHNMESNQ